MVATNRPEESNRPGGSGMRRSSKTLPLCLLILAVSLTLIHCGASNRLREYEFRNHTAAVTMATPPPAQVFNDSFFLVDEGDVLGTAIRIGTSVVKGVEARKTQDRLNAAMENVDIPEQIRVQTLAKSSEYLHFQPTAQTGDADFLFMMDIDSYGIDADSWDSSVHFKIDVRVRLVDNRENTEIWKKNIKERQVVSREAFGLGGAVGNVISAVTLSELSEEEMIKGLAHLADYVADRVAERIHRDFIKAHSD
jgi:hypothetical protein